MNSLQTGWPKCGLAIVCDDVAAIGHSENVRSQPAARWTGQRHLGRDVDVLVMHPAFFEQQQLRLVGENPFQVGLGKPDIGERLRFTTICKSRTFKVTLTVYHGDSAGTQKHGLSPSESTSRDPSI